MHSNSDVRRFVLFLALSIVLTTSAVQGDPITGSSSEPIPTEKKDDGEEKKEDNADKASDPASKGAVALPLRIGNPAALRKGYFSPTLGAKFEMVQVQVAGSGLVDGARLTEEPIAGSPLAGKGLADGDTITHLDGDPVLQTSELEAHHDATTVSWVADQTQKTRTLKIVIPVGKTFADPNNPGNNVGIAGPPIQAADIVGKWNCSCGAIWTFQQQGNTVTGNEADARKNNSVSGTLKGRTFAFDYINPTGLSGAGTFTADSTFSSMTGTIRWRDGTTSSPTLTRVQPNAGVAKNYTVIGLKNNSKQVVSCEIRWGSGGWLTVQLQPYVQWIGWSEGHRQQPQLRDSTKIIDLSGTRTTLQRSPTIQDANVYNVRLVGGEIFVTQ